jgi:hypothetical protein
METTVKPTLRELLQNLENKFNKLEEYHYAKMEMFNKILNCVARIEAKIEEQINPIRLEMVDEGNFNFPISSIPKGEGVGELKFPESLPVVDPILEVVSSDLPSVPEFFEPKDLIPAVEPSQIPSSECFFIREETVFPTLPVKLEEKAEKIVSCQIQVVFLFFFYEYEIPKRYLRMFLHLEDFLYDLYEYNISKFLLW